jgi:hypothetical protein
MKPKHAKILAAFVVGACIVAGAAYMMRAKPCPAVPPQPAQPAQTQQAQPAQAQQAEHAQAQPRAEAASRVSVATRGVERAPDTLEKSFADVASTVLDRTGVDDRINPVMSTKNGGMLPILDVRGDYDAMMPFEDTRCDENGRWNQSSKQQSIRIGLIKDVMKRRVVVA